MRICFCDDEETFHRAMEQMVQNWSDKRARHCQLCCYKSAEEMLFETGGDAAFDLIMLDVRMGRMDGIALARKIRENDSRVMIAFLTSDRESVFDGYEVQAARYLLKPVQEDKLFELLDMAASQSITERKCLILDIQGEKKKLYIDQISAVESQGHYLIFHSDQGNFEQKATLASMTAKLGEGFVQTHRSFYVNLAHLTRIGKTECLLDTGETIPVSRSAYKKLNEEFIRYYKEEIV